MKRRRFVQNLLVAPVIPAAAAAQQTAPAPPVPQANGPARQILRQPQNVPKLAVTQPDLAAETDQRFFTPDQFATLTKLGQILVPPLKGHPGAAEAHAPEFLDFLIGVSTPNRQKLYRDGLDGLNTQAGKQFQKAFVELDGTQAHAIIRPLLTARHWPQDMPADPMKHFMAQVHEDLQTATMNSREWAETGSKGGLAARAFNRSSGYYWHPIDPVVRD